MNGALELQQIVHEGLDDALEYIVKAHKAEATAESNFLLNQTLLGITFMELILH